MCQLKNSYFGCSASQEEVLEVLCKKNTWQLGWLSLGCNYWRGCGAVQRGETLQVHCEQAEPVGDERMMSACKTGGRTTVLFGPTTKRSRRSARIWEQARQPPHKPSH